MSLVNVYDYTGGGNAINGTAAAALGVGTFQLEDIRDHHPYIVRRLADGNCWMVEDLDLDLSTVGVLTSEDSDVNEDWDPYGKVAAADFATWALNNLGEAQPAQYQNKSQTGYYWGSKYYDDNGVKTLGDTVLSNEYSQIPRSYNNDLDTTIQ